MPEPRDVHRRPSRTAHRAEVAVARLFTLAEARDAGWSDDAIRHAVRMGRWVRLGDGVLVVAGTRDLGPHEARRRQNLRAAAAAVLRCPRAAISHASAAMRHDLPTLGCVARACITVPAGTALRELAGVHLHRARLPVSDILVIDGLRVTSVARSVLDLARESGSDAGVAAADAALHRSTVARADLERTLDLCAGWPGRAAAQRTLALCDGAAESPLESLSRLRMLDHRLPRPDLQTNLGDRQGSFLARVDFYWPEFGVVGQADGTLKYDSHPKVVAEKRQQESLEQLGVVVVRWGWDDLYAFSAVADRLRSAFARGQRQGTGRRWSVLPAGFAFRFGATSGR